MTGRALVTAVREELAAGGDPDRAVQQQAYMRSEMPYRGFGVPEVRALVRRLVRDHPLAGRADWERAALTLWDGATHREEWYAALALLRLPQEAGWVDPALLPTCERLVREGQWWDVVDEVATHVVREALSEHPVAVAPSIRAWASDEDLWLRRTAIICQVRRGHDTDTDLLADAIEANLVGSPHGSDFFIRKAVGWALRDHARTDAWWVRAFVDDHADRLAPLSRREALKHLPG